MNIPKFLNIGKLLKSETFSKKIAEYIVGCVRKNMGTAIAVKVSKPDIEILCQAFDGEKYRMIKPEKLFAFGLPISIGKIINSFGGDAVKFDGYLIISKPEQELSDDLFCVAVDDGKEIFCGLAKDQVRAFLVNNAENISKESENVKN